MGYFIEIQILLFVLLLVLVLVKDRKRRKVEAADIEKSTQVSQTLPGKKLSVDEVLLFINYCLLIITVPFSLLGIALAGGAGLVPGVLIALGLFSGLIILFWAIYIVSNRKYVTDSKVYTLARIILVLHILLFVAFDLWPQLIP